MRHLHWLHWPASSRSPPTGVLAWRRSLLHTSASAASSARHPSLPSRTRRSLDHGACARPADCTALSSHVGRTCPQPTLFSQVATPGLPPPHDAFSPSPSALDPPSIGPFAPAACLRAAALLPLLPLRCLPPWRIARPVALCSASRGSGILVSSHRQPSALPWDVGASHFLFPLPITALCCTVPLAYVLLPLLAATRWARLLAVLDVQDARNTLAPIYNSSFQNIQTNNTHNTCMAIRSGVHTADT